METTEIEFFIAIDQDGDYVLVKDESDISERYTDEVSTYGPQNLKVIKMTLTVPLPKIVEISAVVPDKGDEPVSITVT